MVYLDTSVLVTALTHKADTCTVQARLARQNSGDLAISDWVMTEFPSALLIKPRTGQLGLEHRAAFRTAARFADQTAFNLRAADALHLALCAELGATLCTLDQRLGAAAPLVGVGVVLL